MYRAVMRLEKVDLLRKEIDVVAQNHQRDVDRKDALIHMLAQDCEEGEEQSEPQHSNSTIQRSQATPAPVALIHTIRVSHSLLAFLFLRCAADSEPLSVRTWIVCRRWCL